MAKKKKKKKQKQRTTAISKYEPVYLLRDVIIALLCLGVYWLFKMI
ncbi:MAG: hypothetical protein MI974_31995 [Chitinophagales bacterium]|nr:hypothetical protein [Chitinophagales bacterium]